MRFRAIVIAAVIALPFASVSQAQDLKATGPTPQQVLDAPKDTVGANVVWVVRYRNVLVDLQPDGKIANSRIIYEWSDSSGGRPPVLVLGPSLQETRFAGESAGQVSVLHSEPRLITGTVRGVEASTGVDGKAVLAVVLDQVTIHSTALTSKKANGPGVGSGSYSTGMGVAW